MGANDENPASGDHVGATEGGATAPNSEAPAVTPSTPWLGGLGTSFTPPPAPTSPTGAMEPEGSPPDGGRAADGGAEDGAIPTPVPTAPKGHGKKKDGELGLRQIRQLARREQVRQLLPRRYTVTQIAKALGTSERVIYKDITFIRREMAAELATTSVMDLANDVIRTSEVLEREAFAALVTKKGQAVPSITERVAVWNFIRQQKRDTIKLLQSLGVTFKAAEKVQVTHVAMDRISELRPDLQEDLANTSDPIEFERKLAQYIGPELAAQFMGKPVGSATALPPGEPEDADYEVVDDDDSDDVGDGSGRDDGAAPAGVGAGQ